MPLAARSRQSSLTGQTAANSTYFMLQHDCFARQGADTPTARGAAGSHLHTGSVTNRMGNWALENLPALEELYGAIEQVSLEAGAAGDSVKETGSLKGAGPSVDIARERVAHAAATVGECPPPPDPSSAWHLAAALGALDEFRTAERFDDLVQAWTRAMEHRDAFDRAFAIASGQQPAGS